MKNNTMDYLFLYITIMVRLQHNGYVANVKK